jgi:hypothetical protein
MTLVPKIIFLDIDGPMVPGRTLLLPGNRNGAWNWKFDPVAVSMLNFLTWAIPELRIVLSSHRWGIPMAHPFDFENTNSKEFWEVVFMDNNLHVEFHEDWITPREMVDTTYQKKPKCQEIVAWLSLHPEVTTFVTLEDDLNGGKAVTHAMRKQFNLFAENYDEGISWFEFELICKKLGLTKGVGNKYAEYSSVVQAIVV